MAPLHQPLSPATLFLLTLTLTLSAIAASHSQTHLCSSSSENLNSTHQCPPFNTLPPPFPFSSSPGCGHPSFQLHCSSPHSSISINDLSFSLLNFQPNSSSLLLLPHQTTTINRHCSASNFPYIPTHPINLSNTPFKPSDAWCSRISLLKPCSPPVLPNCSVCPFHCSLIKNPAHLLLHGCGSESKPVSEQGCQSDVLDFLNRFINIGIELVYDENQDPFFVTCRECRSRNGICGFNSTDPGKGFVCLIDEIGFTPSWIHHKVAVLSTVFALLCILCFLVMAFIHLWNRRLVSSLSPEDPTAMFLHRHRSAGRLLPPVFTFEELESSTNRFDPKRKIGDGGFGSVYLGQLPSNGFVAVKQLHHFPHAVAGRAFSTKSFCNEILILSSIGHPNLVKLHGYCSDPRGLILVYDYIPNGTLADHLHGPRSVYRNGALTWQVRVDIALQIAMAIEYLHFSFQPPVVHRDITTSNIFVEKDMRVKLGDFGLSRLLSLPEKTEDSDPSSANNSSTGFVWTGPQGTPGYLDPDYHRSFQLNEKSDVYSYGVVLMELVTGMKAVDRRREKREVALAEMVVSRIQMGLLHQVVDPVLAAVEGDGVVKESVGAVAELAFRCVASDKDDRPDSREVVAELRRIWSRTRGMRGSNSNVVVVPES